MEPKMTYLSSFGISFEKAIVIFEMNIPKFVIVQGFMQKRAKRKNFEFGTKNDLFGISRLIFKKAFVMFKISPFEFAKVKTVLLKK